MNRKFFIGILIALCCLQLTLAQNGTEPKIRRTKSKRPVRSTSSKSPRRSRTLKPTITKTDDSNTDSITDSSDTDDAGKAIADLMKTLSGMDLAPDEKTDFPKYTNIAKNIPVQRANQNVIIEGKNGKIFINNTEKYPFTGTRVVIEIRDGDFYVNNNLVLKKGSPREVFGSVVIYSWHTLKYNGVTNFTLKIDSKGYMHYKDNTGENLDVNYITRINFGSLRV